MSMRTGNEVPVAAAPNSRVPITRVIKICLSMSISPIPSNDGLKLSSIKIMKPLMADQGLPGSCSIHPNPYLLRGEGAKSPAKPPITADPNAMIISGID